jgi:hypothetical protein
MTIDLRTDDADGIASLAFDLDAVIDAAAGVAP